MPFLQHPDFKIHYAAHEGGSIPIVLIHGNFGSHRHWQLFYQNNESNFSIYAPDLRGCGDSEAPKTGYDIKTLSQDLLFLVNHLHLEKFHLVGHSLGGAVAQEFSGTFPERILSLTLVAPAPAEGLEIVSKDSISSKYFHISTVFHYLDKFNLKRTTLHSAFKKTMPGLKEKPLLLDLLVEDAMKMDDRALQGFVDTLQSWRGTQHLQKFNFPVLMIHGGLDTLIKKEPLETMAEKISDCRFSKWKGVGHAPQMERADAFNYLLKGFILGSKEPIEVIEALEIIDTDKTERSLLQQLLSKLGTVKKWFKKLISKYT